MFTELPQTVIDELGLYVKVKENTFIEYAFIGIEQCNLNYNSHLIWCDSGDWYVACDIHVFKTQSSFQWCYYSSQHILNLKDAVSQLKLLKSHYTEAFKKYKLSQQDKRLSKLKEDF